MNLEELEAYFIEHNSSTYERNRYDEFINDFDLSYSFNSIHITGTNGKGSTSNYIYNIYLNAGYKVGLFISPYFVSPLEMISINGKEIDFETYISIFNELIDRFEKYQLTSFEMQTIIAFEIFKRANLDMVVVEVGMGGYVDATNIIIPKLSIITSVSLEHTAYLGRSISEIAYNKAGIIKRNVPCLLGKLDDTAMFAIRDYAKLQKSPIYIVDDYHNETFKDGKIAFDYFPYQNLELNTLAKYQLSNASLAVEAVKILQKEFPVKEDDIRKGLLSKTLPGRFEEIAPNLIVDGAHNADGIDHLVESIEGSINKPIHIVFACFRDKNVDAMLNSLGKISNNITLTTFDNKRARSEEEYFLYLGDYDFVSDYQAKINELRETYPDDVVLVTGSLAFVGLVRELYK